MRIASGWATMAAIAISIGHAGAQQSARPTFDTRTITSGFGIDTQNGGWIGIGHDFKADFVADGIDYTPALGSAAPHDMPWRFRLNHAGRRSALAPVAGPKRELSGNEVRYHRGSVVETYQVRRDGVKQSFVFTNLPAGSGDLVVRGEVATELVAGAVTANGMTFDLPGIGGVTIGAVVGIDGTGKQVAGTMRWDAGLLEFALPASFVDSAVLPLTIDPLVGTAVTLGGANDDFYSDIAWDATSASWLAVWERPLSGTNRDIRGQRLDFDGTLIGGQVNIETATSTIARFPKVANVNERNAWVVVWSAGGDVFARGVVAATAALTPEITAVSGSNNQVTPDIGGEAAATGDEAVLVWADGTADSVSLRTITYTAANTLTLGAVNVIGSGFSDAYPRISKSGGAAGFWLIVWHRTVASQDIRARIWNRTAGFVTSLFAIETGPEDCLIADCDGDGYNWVVAYSREEANNSDFDVVAHSVRMHPSGVTVGPQIVVEAGLADSEVDPAVCWTGNSALVAYADEVSGNDYDAYVRSIDPFRCTLCEGEFLLASGATQQNFVACASRFAGGSFTSSEAACMWNDYDVGTGNGDIGWQRFRADDGSATDLGGGCGNGGLAYATCGRSPNSGFELRLRRATPSAAAFCILGFQRLDYVCGPCQLIADPYSGLIITNTTDTVGEVVRPLPIPAGVAGNTIILQWLVAGSNCFTSFDMSNAVQISIQ